MLRVIWMFSVVAGCCLLMGCERIMGEEPDVEYTISGRVFRGLSDEPMVNTPVMLEGVKEGVFGAVDFLPLGEAVTDEDGYFSITYSKIHNHDAVAYDQGDYVSLRTDEVLSSAIETLPWNTSLSKDFAEFSHSRAFIQLEGDHGVTSDSVYLSIALLIGDQPFISSMEFPDLSSPSAVAHVSRQQLEDGILLKSLLGSDWNNSPRDGIVAYGENLPSFQKAHSAFLHDSVSNDFNRIEYSRHGFPVTDTIKLEL